ncbi:isocitrate/isopropylmalate family dehydrogenase [Sinomonas sp. R1AF57]|uniref:isocitrate/isopropylmalate family dehydrogenase n=1 Tax=Sinomonas sp. R1AF57 TaxID=2020377 RepID=UPI000B6193CF|nr:hypothetical protein CGQ25_15890 [Sinomonas sp. R1AF57]
MSCAESTPPHRRSSPATVSGRRSYHPQLSAPDIAGKGIANPIGAMWSTSMMLDHLEHSEAGADILSRQIRSVLAEGQVRTRDMGWLCWYQN